MLALGADEDLDGILAAGLAGLLAHAGVLAHGAGDGDGLVPGGVVALGVVGAAVEDLAEAGLAGAEAAAALGAGHGEDLLLHGLAGGVVHAADELAVAAVALHEALAAVGAQLARGLVRGHGDALGIGLHDALALGVVGAGPEGAPLALAQVHGRGAAERALRRVAGLLHLFEIRRVVALVLLGLGAIVGAAHEEPVAADALQQHARVLLAVAALGALLPRGHAGLEVLHVLAGGHQGLLEGAVEIRHGLLEGELALLDAVEVALHARGVLGIHEIHEPLQQQLRHRHAEIRGLEAALVLLHVVAINDGADDAGVGGRPADAVFFQFLHQGGLVE